SLERTISELARMLEVTSMVSLSDLPLIFWYSGARSFTKSSALTFFNGSTRIVTSWGFSVSRIAINLSISGSFDLGAVTMSRLEVLSGQIRTCCAPVCAPPPGAGWGGAAGGPGPAPGGRGPAPGGGGPREG